MLVVLQIITNNGFYRLLKGHHHSTLSAICRRDVITWTLIVRAFISEVMKQPPTRSLMSTTSIHGLACKLHLWGSNLLRDPQQVLPASAGCPSDVRPRTVHWSRHEGQAVLEPVCWQREDYALLPCCQCSGLSQRRQLDYATLHAPDASIHPTVARQCHTAHTRYQIRTTFRSSLYLGFAVSPRNVIICTLTRITRRMTCPHNQLIIRLWHLQI
jgi:hypothetical protein